MSINSGNPVDKPIRVGEGPDNAKPIGVHPQTGATVRIGQAGDSPRRPEALQDFGKGVDVFAKSLETTSSPLTAMNVSLVRQPESPRDEARALARAMVEHFKRPANRDKIYPPEIVKVKSEYENANQALVSVGRDFLAGDPFSFDAIELDEFERLDMETRVDEAMAGAPPQEASTRGEAAATDFLKEIAESRTGNDRATYLCRWMAGRAEMTPKERWNIMREMVDYGLEKKPVTVDFRDTLEGLTRDVFVTRARDYFEDLEIDIQNGDKERFFPDDILSLRSSAHGLDWSNPLPELLTPSNRNRLREMVREIALENRPLTETPDDTLREAVDSYLKQYANDLVATTPSLFAMREIAARNGLTREQKCRVATEIDYHISNAPGAFPQDDSGCPQFAPQAADRQRRGLHRAINEIVARLPNRGGAG